MTAEAAASTFLSRQARFASVDSTNDVVAGWLDEGVPEVCVAVADEQRAGRGRAGRTWVAPAGCALLVSLGFRPTWIAADRAWRIPATLALAMADAAEEAGGLTDRAVRLKWPNDLVVEASEPGMDGTIEVLKLGGILAEARDVGGTDPTLVVGLGLNADWAMADFPAELAGAMTSLREASGGRPVDLVRLLDAFLLRVEPRIAALREGWFDVADWTERQVTTGRTVRVELPDRAELTADAVGVDALGGGLVVRDDSAANGERTLLVGDVRHVRLAEPEV
jgi:BirA family biotin operon repressor/biotin-[acetyl-CoA-carboxylase] ligase